MPNVDPLSCTRHNVTMHSQGDPTFDSDFFEMVITESQGSLVEADSSVSEALEKKSIYFPMFNLCLHKTVYNYICTMPLRKFHVILVLDIATCFR